jgi:hypothetical protein
MSRSGEDERREARRLKSDNRDFRVRGQSALEPGSAAGECVRGAFDLDGIQPEAAKIRHDAGA